MAIAIDSRNAGTKTVGATSLSWNHVMGAVSNGMLLVFGTTGSGTLKTMSTCVWDDGGANTAMSKTVNSVTAEQADTASNVAASVWWLAAPASGTKTIKLTPAASCEMTGGSASYSGCAGTFNAASPQKAQFAANTNASTAVTSANGEWCADVVGVNENGGGVAPVVGAGQTQIFSQNIGTTASFGFGSDEASTTTSTTMSWTGMTAGNFDSAQVCVSLLPSGAAPAAVPSRMLMGVGA